MLCWLSLPEDGSLKMAVCDIKGTIADVGVFHDVLVQTTQIEDEFPGKTTSRSRGNSRDFPDVNYTYINRWQHLTVLRTTFLPVL